MQFGPAGGKAQDDGAALKHAGGFDGQPFGGHGLAKAGVGGEDRVEEAFGGDPQQGVGELPGLGADLLRPDHLPRHVRVEGQCRQPLQFGAGESFLEERGRHVGSELYRQERGRIAVEFVGRAAGFQARRRREGRGVQAQVVLLLWRERPGLHGGDDLRAGALERLAHGSVYGGGAGLGRRHHIEVGQPRAFQRRPAELLFLRAEHVGELDRLIVVPLVTAPDAETGHGAKAQAHAL